MKRVHVYISGKVQGVGFRAATKRKAEETGVSGWVRNLADGRVEAVFEGEEQQVEQMMEFCHGGPRTAEVENVEVEQEEPEGLAGFEVRR